MATQQTTTQRKAAAKKAAATRQRNSAKRSAAGTKASARQTRSTASAGARSTARSTRSTSKRAARTATSNLEAATTRLEAVSRQAQRAVLIQIGAAVSVRDSLVHTAQLYTDRTRLRRELKRFERRGEGAVRRSRQVLSKRSRGIEHDIRGLRTEATDVVDRLTRS